MTRDEALDVAAAGLGFIAGDESRLARFASLTGADPPAIRANLRQLTFLAGILDYLLEDEPLLLEFIEEAGLTPDAPSLARDILAAGDI